MQKKGAMGKTWVRACVLIATSLVVFVGLFIVSGTLIEGGDDTVGFPLAYLDWASLLVAVFLGPAWVLQAFRAPAPPSGGGPPGGDPGPAPKCTPDGSISVDVVEVAPIEPPDAMDDEIRALLCEERVPLGPR